MHACHLSPISMQPIEALCASLLRLAFPATYLQCHITRTWSARLSRYIDEQEGDVASEVQSVASTSFRPMSWHSHPNFVPVERYPPATAAMPARLAWKIVDPRPSSDVVLESKLTCIRSTSPLYRGENLVCHHFLTSQFEASSSSPWRWRCFVQSRANRSLALHTFKCGLA